MAPQTIADIDLGNTVTKVEDLYTLTTILKGANGISQGGNPIDSTVVLKVPKGISIDDMVYYNGTQFSIKPDFIEEFIGTDTTGKLTELQIQNVTQPIVANNDSIKPNSVNTIIDQSMAEIIDVSTLDMTRSQGISFTKSSVNLNRSYEGYDYVVRPQASLSEVLDSLKDITDKKILIELKGVEELNPSLIENISDNISFRISNYNSNYINGENFLYTLEHLTYNAEEIKTIATKLDEIKSGIDDNWSDYQKAEYVYNYLKDNIKYNPSPGRTLERSKEHDGLNSLIVGESTCQGFAHTYRMILNSFGIECEEVWGKLKGVPDVGQHAYTVVKIGDNVFVVDPVRELLTNHPGTGFGVSFENFNNEYNQRTNNELLKKLNWENSEGKTPKILDNANSEQLIRDARILQFEQEFNLDYKNESQKRVIDSIIKAENNIDNIDNSDIKYLIKELAKILRKNNIVITTFDFNAAGNKQLNVNGVSDAEVFMNFFH